MTPKFIVIHTAAVKDASFEAVRRYHIEERGWSDIGYHYYIEKDGKIHQGREEDKIGAHCRAADMNHKSLGICFEGHHDHEDWTYEQKDSALFLIQKLKMRYNIPKDHIIGHREAYDIEGVERKKTCPGTMIDMVEVRSRYGRELPSTADPAEQTKFSVSLDDNDIK
jgi:N-acetyl-anhydromuramyl-L-alanine amidase AmpD